MLIQEPKRQRSYIELLGESRFGPSQLGDGALQEDLGIPSLVCV